MKETYREKYLSEFKKIYFVLKNNGIENFFEASINYTNNEMKKVFNEITDEILEGLELEVDTIYNGSFEINKPSILTDSHNLVWFDKTPPEYKYFWYRYEKYLVEHKNWAIETVKSIGATTDEILKRIGNPSLGDPFDKRGLVLGHVQSGKTANFTGLINKAFDVGYKLVIVLAGMHNDLRSQTQLRLEREVVGSVDSVTGEKQGVALIKSDGIQIETWTSVQNDISTSNTIGVKNLDKPILLVVKKQKDVLPALIDLLKNSINLSGVDTPLLVIDDEADQASVDASGIKTDKPTMINRQIRELLELFKRKSYVGYTATPFANLLIDAKKEHTEVGKDLYPKDFVIALPQPIDYCGPDKYFNTTGYVDNDKPVYIRHISLEDKKLLDQLRSKDDANLFSEVPQSMRESILSFLISIAIRELRGQINTHNSMLIHTSRFTDVQNCMCEVIEEFYQHVTNEICYSRDSKYIETLEKLYKEDFIEVQKSLNETDYEEIFEWKDVYQKIRENVGKIKVMEINGESDDALEYDKYKERGLNVIAVGGNKLSRGLTLEGLTVSYYYRTTAMYDTLLQMGRWFGYRNGYMDLCRIYTSEEIAENFEYLALVMTELREEFDKYAKENITPLEYAARMLKHPKMSVTSPLKMKNAESSIDYSGEMQQTRSFETYKSFYEKNMNATVNFINEIQQDFEKVGKTSGTKYHIAKDVPSNLVVKFLAEYQTLSTARIVNSKKIADFIINEGFSEFNVAVVDITPTTYNDKNIEKWPVNLGKLRLESAVARSMDKDKSRNLNVIDLGAIVAANQEFIDLTDRTKSKSENRLLRNKNNPLILIYPLHPKGKPFTKAEVTFSEDLVPIGLAFSFPNRTYGGLDSGSNKVKENNGYIFNNTVGGNIND